MRAALLRTLSLCTRNRRLFHKPSYASLISRNVACISGGYFRDRITISVVSAELRSPSATRFFSSGNGSQDSDQSDNDSETVGEQSLESKEVKADVEDVSTKEFKAQISEFLRNGKIDDDEAISTIFESILKRSLSGKHEETDDDLKEELRNGPLSDVDDEDFEEGFEKACPTDDEIDHLYDARSIVMKRMTDNNPYFSMDNDKWEDMIKESVEHGYLKDTRECEQILEDMVDWDKLLPDQIKRKVRKKFNEIAYRIEKQEIEVEEGYALFKEFEDEMVVECTKLMEADALKPDDLVPDDGKESDDPPGEGPILRWRTRVVLSPGGDSWHPKNRKVKLAVTVKELGLSKHQFLRLRELAGKRYNPGKDELTITSERFEYREENRKDCLRTLFALIEECAKASKLVEDARTEVVKERLKANAKFMQRLQEKKQALQSSDKSELPA